MYSHVMVGVNDMDASKKFYDALFAALGQGEGVMDEKGRCFYFGESGIFALTPPIDGNPATHGNGSTIGFAVDSPEKADAWHAAGVANGGTAIEEPPGVREGCGMKLYLAYLLDPAGNKICTMCRV